MRLLVWLLVLGCAALAVGVCCHVSVFEAAIVAAGLAGVEMLIPSPSPAPAPRREA